LLIEESRTNIIPRSQAFDDSAVWAQIRLLSQPIANTHIAPDGTLTAEKLIPSAISGDHRIDRSSVSGLVAGTIYTMSIFVKADGYTGFGINLGSSPAPIGVTYNLENGTVSSTVTGWSATIQSYPNGWYRCTATLNYSAGNRLYFSVGQNGTIFSYAGNETDGVILWGAQVEAGSFATSYIPTTTGSVVRSADVCSISGADFTSFYNPLEGSLAASVIFNAPVANTITQAIVDINDTTTANRLRIFRSSSIGFASFSNTSDSTQNVSIAGSVALQPLTTQKYSSGFKLDDYAFYVNNNQVGTADLGAMPISVTTFTIGDASAAFSPRLYLNGTLAAIRYYRKRLPNAKLQALTA
jgi:hypothetical protein